MLAVFGIGIMELIIVGLMLFFPLMIALVVTIAVVFSRRSAPQPTCPCCGQAVPPGVAACPYCDSPPAS